MDWFKNFKVKTKMLVSFLLVIALMATLAVTAIAEQLNVAGKYENTIEGPIEAAVQMKEFERATLELRRLTASMVMYAPANDPVRIDGYSDSAQSVVSEGLAAIDTYRQILIGDSSAAQEIKDAALEMLAAVEDSFLSYKSEVTDSVALEARAGSYEGALSYVNMGVEIGNILTEQTAQLIATAQGSAEANVADANALANSTILLLVGITAAAAVAALVIALYVANLISKPLLPLTAFMNKASTTGDLSLEPKDLEVIGKFAKLKDETGQTIGAAAAFVARVTEVSNMLTAVSGGDLSLDVTLLSENDTMGLALKNMLENLNTMFGDINTSAEQVSVGSKQIADGAQSLAQGSTEQAASVEELSSSVTDINEKTKINAEMTGKAAELADTIKHNAEQGSRRMGDMITAVEEISNASQDISRIIKVIDDIAFQTNILALNAAVEAARAGTQGKGFAVVAEEVRSLAAKSSDAAKETGDLINASIEKVDLGSRIANETSESLAGIVNGINESSELISEIARSSEEQSLAISQINTGLDQVAQVVQQNSATAQESAAASEEMSGQSEVLQELISHFKLSDSMTMRHRLLPIDKPVKQRFARPRDEVQVYVKGEHDFGGIDKY